MGMSIFAEMYLRGIAAIEAVVPQIVTPSSTAAAAAVRTTTLDVSSAKTHESHATIEWLADYERGADARRAAWEASPFAAAVEQLFRPAHLR